MAKILYTVCGVGLGHASRSAAIISKLLKKHDVLITSYGKAYDFLKQEFKSAREMRWFELVFKKERLSKSSTIFHNLPLLPYIAASNLMRAVRIVHQFKPDIIVTDFDVNGLYIAKLFNLPVVTISNMHILNYLPVEMKPKEKLEYLLTEKPMLDAFSPTDYLFVASFLKPKTEKKNVQFYYPIVRDKFLKAKPRQGDFVLIYDSHVSTLSKSLLPLLYDFPEHKFVIYGNFQPHTEKNVTFKSYSEDGFFKDLLNCKCIISHGGISVLSEATILKKPMIVYTKTDFFERYFNGILVQQLGFGELYEQPSKENLFYFLGHLRLYRQNLKKSNIKPENHKIVGKISEIISNESSKKRKLLPIDNILKSFRRELANEKIAVDVKNILKKLRKIPIIENELNFWK